jgi:hypothetical protein
MNKVNIYLGENKIETIEMNYKMDLSDYIMKINDGLYSVIIYYTNNKGKKEIQKEYRMVIEHSIYELYSTKDKNKRIWNIVNKKIFNEFKICCDMVIQINEIYGKLYKIVVNNTDKMIDKIEKNIIDCCDIDVKKEIDNILKYYNYKISSIRINGNENIERFIEDEFGKKEYITVIDVDINSIKYKNLIWKVIKMCNK